MAGIVPPPRGGTTLVPDGLGAGLFYWAPDWIPGVPWEPGTGIGSPRPS
jgi:arabinogalactan endo-1,4-beta-galactosidase